MADTETEAECGHRCIECGHACPELYHSYCDGVVKLIHCVMLVYICCHSIIFLLINNIVVFNYYVLSG